MGSRYNKGTMEQQVFFNICIDYRGFHRKGIVIFNGFEVVLQQQKKTLVSLNKNVFLNTTERLTYEKNTSFLS